VRAYAGTRLRLAGRPLYAGLSAPVRFPHGGLGPAFWLGFLSFFLVAAWWLR
jgi:hypothetical protein